MAAMIWSLVWVVALLSLPANAFAGRELAVVIDLACLAVSTYSLILLRSA